MANPPVLKLTLVDAAGKPLGENVDVVLRHRVLSEIVRIPIKASGPVDVKGLRGAPQGAYRIEMDPPSYQSVARFLDMKASGVTPHRQVFAVDPSKVVSVTFPPFNRLSSELKTLLSNSNRVLGFENLSGQALYDALTADNIRCAGVLNIAAKSRVTGLGGGKTVLPAVTELLEVRGDRFFARVPRQLREDTKNSVHGGFFKEVSGSLHHPQQGYTPAGSFKTHDAFGNLQLTFSMNSEDCVADIDIDDANGFEHVFQVLRNAISGKPTHPYNIHEILLAGQGIDPGYTFNFS